MFDWLKRIFGDPLTLGTLFASGLVGLVMGISQGFVQKKHGGWPGFIGSIGTAVAVAIIVGLGLQDYITSEALRLSVVGLCAVISEDIWMGIRAIGRNLREDPIGTVVRLLEAIRGRSSGSSQASGSGGTYRERYGRDNRDDDRDR